MSSKTLYLAMIDNEVTFQIWTSGTRRSLVTSRTRVRMSGILQARTYLFRSHSQLRDVVTPLRDLYAGHSLLFSLSHNTPDLEHAISQLSSCSGETLGCLSSPLPVENPSHMFSCSIAVFEKERSVPFSTLESSDMTIQIGRARSYRKQEMEYEGNSKNPQLHNISSWDRLWDERHSISLPKELKNKRYMRIVLL